jgi:hypothetical protein
MKLNNVTVESLKYAWTSTNNLVDLIDDEKLKRVTHIQIKSFEDCLKMWRKEIQVIVPGKKYEFNKCIMVPVQISKLSILNIFRKIFKKPLKKEIKKEKVNLTILFNVIYPENFDGIIRENEIHISELNSFDNSCFVRSEGEIEKIVSEYKDLLYTRMFIDKAFDVKILL